MWNQPWARPACPRWHTRLAAQARLASPWTLSFHEENWIPALRYFQRPGILQTSVVTGFLFRKTTLCWCLVRYIQRGAEALFSRLTSQCFQGFVFQTFNFRVFLEIELSPYGGCPPGPFLIFVPHSSKGWAHDKAPCCIYLFLLAFIRYKIVTRTVFPFDWKAKSSLFWQEGVLGWLAGRCFGLTASSVRIDSANYAI